MKIVVVKPPRCLSGILRKLFGIKECNGPSSHMLEAARAIRRKAGSGEAKRKGGRRIMELKLKKAGHDYYEPLAFTPFSCETMRESIVPDSCADIARIVETTGMVYLRPGDDRGWPLLRQRGGGCVGAVHTGERGRPLRPAFSNPLSMLWGEPGGGNLRISGYPGGAAER